MRLLKSKKILVLILFITLLVARHLHNRYNYFYVPKYQCEDISSIVDKNQIVDTDYDKIFKMTGISPVSFDEMLKNGRKDDIIKLNKLYFEKSDYTREYILYPTTAEDTFKRNNTPLVPLKNGDVLITFSTHTLDWRHGHAAIVTDASSGQILEHMSIGNGSCYGYAKNWGRYTNFVLLRHPDSAIAQKASQYAKENLHGIDYNLFVGFLKKDKSDESPVSSSHCSHIVWQAYKAVGVDLDYNSGAIVTPKDISLSPELNVIQIFGVNPDDYIDRVMK